MATTPSPPVLRTRIAVPPLRSHAVPRQRLVDRLNHAAQRAFTLLQAPAGFGKTTLLTQWIEAQ